ncbi:amine oxidase [Plakobranchus ocellatus]|uniref:Amine oxidase n=1 Tax=Plakobranchus ocellatus TaxID=259542 RepID=A0AAV4D442_9GAST|nr:amine oxidase [Plakobranchus ocellatus]
MESFECDVVVIGAGLSGLSAAYHLTKKDKSLRVVVLEAKDRVGGRTLTRQLTAADGTKDFFDIGGEWVGRPQPHMHYLLQKFGIHTFNPVVPPSEGGGDAVRTITLSWQTQLDLYQLIWKMKRLKKKVSSEGADAAQTSILSDSTLFSSYIEQNLWTEEAKKLVDSAIRCMFGLAPSEMTLLYFLMYVNAAGGMETFLYPKEYSGGECRVKGGVQQLSHNLMLKIGKSLVFLKQPVVEIIQSIEGACIRTSNQMQILCQRVIMAIPPHHAVGINYQPPMPLTKKGLLQSVPLAFLIKFVITYEEDFWSHNNGRRQYGFQAVLSNAGSPVGVVYDATSGRGNPALAGFVSSAVSAETDPKNRKTVILKLIEKHLGPACYRCIEFSQLDWSQEQFNGGCFLKSIMPGTTSYFNNDLREPFDRIHFAGTETATVWCGFMNGAIQSGFRAATEVLYHLRPLIVSSPYPESLYFEEDERFYRRSSRGEQPYAKWLMLGVGCVGLLSAIYFLSKSDRMMNTSRIAHPGTFVKNMRLVFESP